MPTAWLEGVRRCRTRDAVAGAVGVVASLFSRGMRGHAERAARRSTRARARERGWRRRQERRVRRRGARSDGGGTGARRVSAGHRLDRGALLRLNRYEASLVEVMPSGEERRFSPFSTLAHHACGRRSAHVFPSGLISATQAERACSASGKRLCKVAEWQQACRPDQRYGYAEERQPGRCNDKGRNPIRRSCSGSATTPRR